MKLVRKCPKPKTCPRPSYWGPTINDQNTILEPLLEPSPISDSKAYHFDIKTCISLWIGFEKTVKTLQSESERWWKMIGWMTKEETEGEG